MSLIREVDDKGSEIVASNKKTTF